ncbi:MAG: zf-HC2 domain-containing protein [Anaerolineales bacterium]|nr:zf-HC2 domain-containing protein [Anaerolineales bacterium]
MNDHDRIRALLPFYAAGRLDETESEHIQHHLAECAECRAELELWNEVSTVINDTNQEIAAPPALARRALDEINNRSTFPAALLRVWHLLRYQAMLLRSELWTASSAMMAIGVIVALMAKKEAVIQFIAPMIAAACLAVIYGPENDPALELTQSTLTSPWKILLARLTLVSSYNLALTLTSSLVLITIIPQELLQSLILSWLGPLTFLSALALLLSIWFGSSNAVTIVYGLWLAQYIHPVQMQIGNTAPALESFFSAYRQFWQNPLPLVILSILCAGLALWSANRLEAISQKQIT